MKKSIKDYDQEIDRDKFWSRVSRGEVTDCWEWQGGKNTTGYGLYSLRSPNWLYERTGRTMTQLLSHRVAWYITKGDIGSDNRVNHLCHHCDNRLCCNPDHMFIGSMWDNVQDMLDKGRAAWQKTIHKN